MTAKERASYIYDPELQCNGEGRQILKTYLDRSTGVRYQVEVVCRKGQWRTLNGQNPLDSW
ncbi:hypothetical protein GW916_00730 [bacterium]|nr:hypothetical protein [bacterium]